MLHVAVRVISRRLLAASTIFPKTAIPQLVNVVEAMANYDFGHECEVIAASIRSANHVTQAALMGADIATVPFGVLKKCIEHPLTERGLVSFLNDWEKVANA